MLGRGRGHRPRVAASLTEHLGRLRPELRRLRQLGVSLDVLEDDLSPVVVTDAINDPSTGEKVPKPVFQHLCEKAGDHTGHRRAGVLADGPNSPRPHS